MINEAFPGVFTSDSDMVAAFGSIWGQSVQAYERTLTPTQTPMDRYLAGDRTAMSALATKGFDVFKGKGGCTNCHTGSALTDATVDLATRLGVLKANGGTQGFHNIGVTNENANAGRQAFSNVDADKGSFKTPGLRNAGMTAPYMHDGSLKTLDEVIDFYANGGKSVLGKPTAGARNAHLDEKQKIISLGTDDRLALKEFLQNGLTDPRTFKNAGPFDHPSLGFNDGSTPLCATDAQGLKTGSGCL
jgi:cytochrome c peroxidase